MSERLTDEQRADWLRLIRSENVGPRTFRALLNQYGGAAAALSALPSLARLGGRGNLRIPTRIEAETEIAAAAKFGVRLVAPKPPILPPEPLSGLDSASHYNPNAQVGSLQLTLIGCSRIAAMGAPASKCPI